jgi:hypothetical protein
MNNLSILNLEKNKSLLEIDTYVSSGKFVKFHIPRLRPNSLTRSKVRRNS